jgi:hypothetical protein
MRAVTCPGSDMPNFSVGPRPHVPLSTAGALPLMLQTAHILLNSNIFIEITIAVKLVMALSYFSFRLAPSRFSAGTRDQKARPYLLQISTHSLLFLLAEFPINIESLYLSPSVVQLQVFFRTCLFSSYDRQRGRSPQPQN